MNNWSNCGDTETRCFHYFRRPRHGPYIYLLHISKNSSAAENCTGVRLGQVFNLSIFYNIRKSWLQTFHAFDFSFRWRDDENHQMGTHWSVKLHQKIRKNLFPCKRIIWLAGSQIVRRPPPRGFYFIFVVSSRFGQKTLSWYSTYLNWLEFSCISLVKILVTDILEISREVLVAAWCRPNPFARYLSQNFLLGRHLPQLQIMGRAEEWNWRYYMCCDLCGWNKAE